MISSDKKMVQAFVNACYEAGMDTVVCSPGSRNSSLVIAFDEHPEITCYVIHDERSAAFVGMGMAQVSKKPVGIVCTSGSAMLNYYPAVSEAYYQRIPLVVISADRPAKWINQGDGQTIVQRGVYTNHIESEAHLSEEIDPKEVRQLVINSFEKIQVSKGPIHFNVALEEPLYNTVEITDELPSPIKWPVHHDYLSSEEEQLIKESLMFPKKMILIGQMPKDGYLEELLKNLAADPSYAILVENTSNLVSMNWIHCIDRTLETIEENEQEAFAPNLLITFGGAIVSKRIKAFLRKHKPKVHIKVGYDFPEMNTYESLTKSIQVRETTFLSKLLEFKEGIPYTNFGAQWKQRDFMAQSKAQFFLDGTPFSDLKAIELILDYIPDGANIHMGNSSIVRYCQLFDPIATMNYFSNRGTSGIDGSTSTAVGAALANPHKLNVILTGDISFFYDSNALWNNYKIPNLRIVIINNGGGGIFNIIKGPRSSKQNKQYFEAQHAFKAEFIARAFGAAYFKAENLEQIHTSMEEFYAYDEQGGMKILEIITENIDNHLILDDYFQHLHL